MAEGGDYGRKRTQSYLHDHLQGSPGSQTFVLENIHTQLQGGLGGNMDES
jgi:hypothetical protein